MERGHFTPFKEVGVLSDWNAASFVTNTLHAIYSTLKLNQDKILQKESFDKLANFVELSSVERNITAVNIAGFGADINKSIRTNDAPSSLGLIDFFNDIVDEIVKKTGKDIILHYNNLERLPEKTMRELFEDLRDFFQNDKAHFVFVGNLTTHTTFQSMPRMSSIMSDTPILLNELSFEDIKKILEIRIRRLRMSDSLNYSVPYNEGVLKTLYELYGGNIRNILNSLSTAVTEITNERPITLTHNLLAATLKTIVEKRYLQGLPKRAKDVLMEAVKFQEITNRNLSRNTKIARSNISTYLSQLEVHGCIYLRRKDGKDKYWSVDPKIKWMLLKARQKELLEFGD